MRIFADPIIVVLLLTNIMILGSASLRGSIRLVAVQGVLLGLFPLVLHGDITLRVLALVCVTIAAKGVAFPWLLSRALRDTDARREGDPAVGHATSLVAGIGALALAHWIAGRLPLPAGSANAHVIPLGLFMIQVGLFLIVSRNKALSQVLGYLVLENGIYAFGVGLSLREHMLVEMCVLLDVFVAVFVMGIIIFHISREFDHIDVDQLSKLKDWHK